MARNYSPYFPEGSPFYMNRLDQDPYMDRMISISGDPLPNTVSRFTAGEDGVVYRQSRALGPSAPTITRPYTFDQPTASREPTGPSGLLYDDPNFRVVPSQTRNLLDIDIGIPEPEIPTDFSGRLGDVRRQSGLAQLSGMLMGLATPTRRGESRLMNSIALGQKLGKEAMAEGKDILAQEIAVDKYQRARDKAIRQREVFRSLFGKDGQAQIDTSYRDSFDYQKLPEAQRQFYDDAMAQQQYGRALMQAGDTEGAKAAFEQSKALQEQAYSGFLTPSDRVKAQGDQRRLWKSSELVPRQNVVDTYNKMVTLSQQAGGLKDYALLINFVKSLDPTSVVREGEVTMAASFQSLQGQLDNLLQKAQKGTFTPELREQMVTIARQMAELATEDYNLAVEKNTPLIQRDRLDPRQVIVEIVPMRPMPDSFATDARTNSVLTDLENE